MKNFRMNKKALTAMLAVVLLVVCAIGGTVAWLTDSSDEVKNTFTYGDINIKLEETTGTEYKMMPGNPITKDPKVIVEADSEACWLFVKITQSSNFSTFMAAYVEASGWNELTVDPVVSGERVYFREVVASVAKDGMTYPILAENKVEVLGTVTKEMLNDLDPKGSIATYPTLTFKAYAVQMAEGTTAGVETAEAAWALVK